MCGIAGVVSTAERATLTATSLNSRIAKRGPDDHRVRVVDQVGDQAVVLCHRRLAIIDLSSAGSQPMSDPSGQVSITFNGEIYNHSELREEFSDLGWGFSGDSDTEVLLAGWWALGAELLHRLNGMFAFAVYDSRSKVLTLVRDRFGVKPLAYLIEGRSVAFASTAEALAEEFGCLPNLAVAARGLEMWAYGESESESLFHGVSLVPAGSLLEIHLAAEEGPLVSTRCWYSVEDVLSRSAAARSLDSAIEEIRFLLSDSVRLRMRSDVPVGLSLSGGLDSSIIAALASQRAAGRLDAFTYVRGGRDIDALNTALIVRVLGDDQVNSIRIENSEPPSMDDLVIRTIRNQGAPFGSTATFGHEGIYARARSRGVLVVHSGQGADEVFMGYHKYVLSSAKQSLRLGHLGSAPSRLLGVLRVAAAERQEWRHYAHAARRYGGGASISNLLGAWSGGEQLTIPGSPEALQVYDLLTGGLPTLLRYDDRNSMACGVEARLPFMDYRVVEFGLNLPLEWKVHGGWGKYVLRKAFASDLPPQIVWDRSKRGFLGRDEWWVARGLGVSLRRMIGARLNDLAEFMKTRITLADIEENYSDQVLLSRASALHEAVTLAWIVLFLPAGS